MADFNQGYVAKMKDVLETYARPYDAEQPVACLDEEPVTLHADIPAFGGGTGSGSKARQ